MVYSAEISRRNPTCILFLLDQSGSMSEPWGNATKAHGLSTLLNAFLNECIIKNSKGMTVMDRFYIGVIGYGFDEDAVGSVFRGNLGGNDLVPISKINDNPANIENRIKKEVDDTGNIIECPTKFRVWVNPTAVSNTPMCKAFSYAKNVLTDWLDKYPECFPPIVVNITDGESTDGKPTQEANQIKSLSSSDGNVLLFNAHISSSTALQYLFPDSSSGLPDEFARMLFEISSTFPDIMRNYALQQNFNINRNSRGFVYNADMHHIVNFLDIGTKSVFLTSGALR